MAATATRASQSEYQAALEHAWAAIEAAHWSDAARAYQRARELLCQVMKTEHGETLDEPYPQTGAAS
jgi:hypothetical protein